EADPKLTSIAERVPAPRRNSAGRLRVDADAALRTEPEIGRDARDAIHARRFGHLPEVDVAALGDGLVHVHLAVDVRAFEDAPAEGDVPVATLLIVGVDDPVFEGRERGEGLKSGPRLERAAHR